MTKPVVKGPKQTFYYVGDQTNTWNHVKEPIEHLNLNFLQSCSVDFSKS